MNLLEHLNIQTKEVSKDQVVLLMEIQDIHLQPYGFLHGGINGVLIETACSIGANAALTNSYAVGVDLQVSHLSSAQTGTLKVVAVPEKIGGRLHFWHADIWLAETKIATGSCTLMINKMKATD